MRDNLKAVSRIHGSARVCKLVKVSNDCWCVLLHTLSAELWVLQVRVGGQVTIV